MIGVRADGRIGIAGAKSSLPADKKWSRLETGRVELLGRLVAGKDEALVLFHVAVPEFGGLAVERARARIVSVYIFQP